MRTASSLLAVVALLATTVTHSTEAQQLCNGYAELCAKTYDQVAYAATHNAYAFQTDALAANQDNNIPTQLKDGVRTLLLEGYIVPSGGNQSDIELCHTTCSLLDGGPVSKVFAQLKTFMDANPNEVITIFWENDGNFTASHFQTVYANAGLDQYSYAQTPGTTTWPTLAQMISSGKRLVSYLDTGSDASVPWLLSEYDFVFETPWQIAPGTGYPCTIDRPKNQRNQLYVLNHFLYSPLLLDGQTVDVPQPGIAAQTNGPDLATHVNNCTSLFSQKPNYIAVDFYEKGTVFPLLAQVNGVTWNGKAPTPATTTSSGSGASSSIGGMSTITMGLFTASTVLGILAL